MTDEQEPHRLGLVYAPDIIETDSGPIDEGTRRALLEQVLIPDASPTAYEILGSSRVGHLTSARWHPRD